MSFAPNSCRLLREAHILYEPRGPNIRRLEPLGPVKSAPMVAVDREDIRRVYILSIIQPLLCKATPKP